MKDKEKAACDGKCEGCFFAELIKEGETYSINDLVFANKGPEHYVCLNEETNLEKDDV